MALSTIEKTEIYDVLGIGFGPAGIALAIAMEDADEEGKTQPWRALFIEQSNDAVWQPDMLLPGTDIQHHFLRDFATPRNPRSRYTFANYLKEKGRLFSFGLLGGNPGRIEWADYVRWVANQVKHRALFSHRVVAVDPVQEDESSPVTLVRVQTQDLSDNTTKEFYARNVVLCSGRKPNIPAQYAPFVGPRMFHSHYFKSSMKKLDLGERPTFAVIGSGQNAIEIVLHLADTYGESQIYSINRNSGFRMYDLGHFSNEVYFPEEVEYFFNLPKESRRRLFEEVRLTNYSSVDPDVSRALYWRVYEEKVGGEPRIHVLKRSAVSEVVEQENGFELTIEELYRHTHQTVHVDVVLLCTGFVEEQVPPMFNALRSHMVLDNDGDIIVSRDYEIETDENFKVGVFLNGLTERTHGISDSTSFSMMALKAQRTLDRLETQRQGVTAETPQVEV